MLKMGLTMRVSDAGCDTLGCPSSCHVFEKVAHTAGRRRLTVAWTPSCPQLHKLGTQPFIDNKVNRCLNDTVVGRCQTAVETTHAFLLVNSTYTLWCRQRPVSSATKQTIPLLIFDKEVQGASFFRTGRQTATFKIPNEEKLQNSLKIKTFLYRKSTNRHFPFSRAGGLCFQWYSHF